MRVWSLQHKSTLETIRNGKAYSVAPTNAYPLQWENPDRLMLNAYDWLVERMKERVGEPPEGVDYPVWAWAKQRGSDSGQPDMSQRSEEALDRLVLFELEIPDDEVLLTDFDLWHFALYCQYLPADANDDEKFAAYLAEKGIEPGELAKMDNEEPGVSEARAKVMESWSHIIDYDIDPDYWEIDELDRAIQATFWQLKPEYIVGTTVFSQR